jgi:hypothetical protein
MPALLHQCGLCGVRDSNVVLCMMNQPYYHPRCCSSMKAKKWCHEYHYYFSLEQKNSWDYNRNDYIEYWTKDKLDQNTRDFYENELFVKDYDGYYKNQSAAHSDARKFFDEYVKDGQTPLVTIVGMCRVIMRRNDFLVDSDDDSDDDVPIIINRRRQN